MSLFKPKFNNCALVVNFMALESLVRDDVTAFQDLIKLMNEVQQSRTCTSFIISAEITKQAALHKKFIDHYSLSSDIPIIPSIASPLNEIRSNQHIIYIGSNHSDMPKWTKMCENSKSIIHINCANQSFTNDKIRSNIEKILKF